jgi:nucleoside-diphosphate-sugar epimerase
MRTLLILGGTHFAGWWVAVAARDAGWQVSVLHRGTRAAPGGVREVVGDRTSANGLAGLVDGARAGSGEWDLVVDTWSHAPRVVQDSARALVDRAGRYVYVSTGSVYKTPFPPGSDESRPVVPGDPDAGDVDYPEAKAGAERAVVAAFGQRAAILRAGMIVGPREQPGRLPWWLLRMARGGDVLAPGPRDGAIQFVDVRDLAQFALLEGLSGPYDVVVPVGHATMADVLGACIEVTAPSAVAPARLRWASPELIAAAGIGPWWQMPLWLAPGPDRDSLFGFDVSRALAAGLICRPVYDTVARTWDWLRAARDGYACDPRLGVLPDAEARALAMLA